MPRKRKRLKVWRSQVRGHFVIRWQWAGELSAHQEATELLATRANQRAADKIMAEKEETLLAERKTGTPWQTVLSRFSQEELVHQKPNSRRKWKTATNRLAELCGPTVLTDVDGSLLSQFGAKLREEELSPDTIAGYFAELRRTLNWAEGIWQEYQAPRVRPPKGAKRSGMKGRPITREEFERMLEATSDVVGIDNAPDWRYYLTGLYLSGLRLQESLHFSWDDVTSMHVLSLDLDDPRIWIPAAIDKGGREDGLPITTDFAWFLDSTPKEKRRGLVFRPRLKQSIVSYWTVSDTITAIGKAARVMVFASKDKIKWASAHDLRRAFGTRWAPHMMPADLQRYMRHQSIQTTMKYYVDLDLAKAGKRTRKATDDFDLINAARELLHYGTKTNHVT